MSVSLKLSNGATITAILSTIQIAGQWKVTLSYRGIAVTAKHAVKANAIKEAHGKLNYAVLGK